MLDTENNSFTIASSRVEGTNVYSRDGEKMGSVNDLLIEKRGGQVTDAILSVGGFLGMGSERHSLPWSKLNYDTELGGYRLDVTQDQLKKAPRFAENEMNRAHDREYQTQVYDYWQVAPYW